MPMLKIFDCSVRPRWRLKTCIVCRLPFHFWFSGQVCIKGLCRCFLSWAIPSSHPETLVPPARTIPTTTLISFQHQLSSLDRSHFLEILQALGDPTYYQNLTLVAKYCKWLLLVLLFCKTVASLAPWEACYQAGNLRRLASTAP